MLRHPALLCAFASLAATLGCGSNGRPGEPLPGALDATVDSSGVDGPAGDAPASDGPGSQTDSAGVDAPGIEASAGEASAGEASAGDAGGGNEAGVPPLCDPTSTWPNVTRIAGIAATGFDRFGSISSNALTVAFTSSSGVIYVADRASTSAPFGTPAQFDPGSVLLANGRVALANSGLRLIATAANGLSFVSFVRPAAGGAWAPSQSNEFVYLAAMIAESGGSMSEPVVSADNLSLFYLLTIGTGTSPILYESAWSPTTKKWSSGTPHNEFGITSAAQVLRPTGASADRQTLFFFDEVNAKQRAANRASPGAQFDTFFDVAIAPEAAPDQTCSTLYFHGTDALGQGLFTATQP